MVFFVLHSNMAVECYAKNTSFGQFDFVSGIMLYFIIFLVDYLIWILANVWSFFIFLVETLDSIDLS